MNIEVEKAAVVEQLKDVEDLELILAIKHLIEFGKKKADENDFSNALKLAIAESEKGEGRTNEEVKAEIYKRFSA